MLTIQRVWRLQEKLIKLVGTECTKCGYVCYPPKAACPHCGSREVRKIHLPRKGRVLSYTILNIPVEGFESKVPLILALVELGKARILTQLTDVEVGEVYIGMPVEATIRKSPQMIEGATHYIIKFKPVDKERLKD